MRRSAALIAAIAAAGVIGSTSGSAAVSAAARSRIKLGTVAPKDSSYHRLLLEMGEQWRNASGGQVELVIYPGGTQGSEADVVKRMSVGELQAGMLSVGGLTEIDPAVSALQEIPMLFQSLAEEEHVPISNDCWRLKASSRCSGATADGRGSSRGTRRCARTISRD